MARRQPRNKTPAAPSWRPMAVEASAPAMDPRAEFFGRDHVQMWFSPKDASAQTHFQNIVVICAIVSTVGFACSVVPTVHASWRRTLWRWITWMPLRRTRRHKCLFATIFVVGAIMSMVGLFGRVLITRPVIAAPQTAAQGTRLMGEWLSFAAVGAYFGGLNLLGKVFSPLVNSMMSRGTPKNGMFRSRGGIKRSRGSSDLQLLLRQETRKIYARRCAYVTISLASSAHVAAETYRRC